MLQFNLSMTASLYHLPYNPTFSEVKRLENKTKPINHVITCLRLTRRPGVFSVPLHPTRSGSTDFSI